MPQCKDRLRYRWLGFHLDLTTSARLRSAATPSRRLRSKRRRPRKQDDHRIEAFNLLFSLGLVPTKSRMNDPQGLLLNRMHVMDGDCPKSEVVAEKAPQLDLSAQPRSSPLLINSNGGLTTATTVTGDTTASLTVSNSTTIYNNNNNNSTKDKDGIDCFSAATTNNLPQSQSQKENAIANVCIPDSDISSTNCGVNDSVDDKKKKNTFGFNKSIAGDKKNDIAADNVLKNLDGSGIINDSSKIVNDNFDDKMGVDSSSKFLNGNKDDNNTSESSDGHSVNVDNDLRSENNICNDDDDDEGDDKAILADVKRTSGARAAGEDADGDIPEDMLVEEEEEEAEEDVEENENADKNMEEDVMEEDSENVLEESTRQKLSDDVGKNDGGESTSSQRRAGVDDRKNVVPEDVVLSLKKQDTSLDLTINSQSSSVVGSINSSVVSCVPASIKTIKDETCAVNNNSSACSEEDDRNSVTSSQSRKRTIVEREKGDGGGGGGGEVEVDNEAEGENEGEASSSESEGGTKRQRVVVEAEDERERLVREYVERCTQSVEEMSRNADKLQREIASLGELARTKELEWNSILRLRKLKEEMLERLLRRRRQAMMLADNGFTQDWATDYTKPKVNKIPNNCNNHNQLMMVPVVSSSPGNLPPPIPTGVNSRPLLSSPDTTRMVTRLQQRPILPKPLISHSQPNLSSSSNNSSITTSLLDQQNTVIGEGRQGPILDVKSIIADYSGDRSRHPENVPRRGRRMKSMVSSTRISGSPALMSMANMALCSGAHIRNTSQDCTSVQENSRPSSTDSTRSTHQTELPAPGLSFKDVLVQFAKMSQPPPPTLAPPIKQPPPPPPPYPEVTLHPVPAPQSPPPTHSSLLHGILTKTTAAPSSSSTTSHRPTTFSPTLARLLTAPERERSTPMMTSQFRPPTSRVSISDLLTSSKKTRNEITITPVSSQSPVAKSKDEVVLLDDDEETDSTDRLVIDESADRDREANGNSDVNSDDVPECQGCHQRAALFVCAGCGNQWYCSRECQVTAWEEHCETCSG